ncbi:hypothetical protein [Paraburkholderia strydomiana]
MRADVWVREAQRESSLVDALYKARNLISMHNGITVRCDGEEWALDFGQELEAIDAALKTAGIDVARFRQWEAAICRGKGCKPMCCVDARYGDMR